MDTTDTAQRGNNQAFYDRISSAYDAIADANEHAAREAGEQALAVQAGEQVLELGFGTGNTLLNLARAVGPDGHLDGIDISEGMLGITDRKLDDAGLQDRVTLHTGDARNLPFDDDQFDAAFASFTLELFPLEDIPLVLAEIMRVLKPGGRLGIVSMAHVEGDERESVLEKTYRWMHQHFPHIVDCQPIHAARRLEEAGFHLEVNDRREIWSMPVAVLVGRKSGG
ncbi:MAG: methyltransferase domain-containing protein [Planctomycetaceae bacterium]|nr:methyltransferase domain-containing protein [Planctomycetaceae bacterium]